MAQALMLGIGGILAVPLNGLGDDGFEWRIRWFTRRLLALAIKCLPETQQDRFADSCTARGR